MAKTLEPVLQKELQNQSAKLGPKLDRRLEKDVEVLKVQVEKDFHLELERAALRRCPPEQQITISNILGCSIRALSMRNRFYVENCPWV